jgi:hypothetical protein
MLPRHRQEGKEQTLAIAHRCLHVKTDTEDSDQVLGAVADMTEEEVVVVFLPESGGEEMYPPGHPAADMVVGEEEDRGAGKGILWLERIILDCAGSDSGLIAMPTLEANILKLFRVWHAI